MRHPRNRNSVVVPNQPKSRNKPRRKRLSQATEVEGAVARVTSLKEETISSRSQDNAARINHKTQRSNCLRTMCIISPREEVASSREAVVVAMRSGVATTTSVNSTKTLTMILLTKSLTRVVEDSRIAVAEEAHVEAKVNSKGAREVPSVVGTEMTSLESRWTRIRSTRQRTL